VTRDWMIRAACRRSLEELKLQTKVRDPFFSSSNEKHTDERYDEARSICSGCPVRAECDEYGKNERWGWWGSRLREQLNGKQIVEELPVSDVHLPAR